MTPDEWAQSESRKRLAEREYPDAMPPAFIELLHKCMVFGALAKYGCGLYTYEAMINQNRLFLMPEVFLMIQICEGATPVELGQTLTENLRLHLEVIQEVKAKWYDIDGEINAKIVAELNSKLNAQKIVPVSHKILKG